MPGSVYGAIVITTKEWFDRCLERGCSVFYFPPGRRPRVDKLSPGSTCLVLARARGVSRGDWLFVGEFAVRSVKRVGGEEFATYASRTVGVPEAPFPKPGEVSWVIEFENLVRYERPVRLGDCKDVRTSTSAKPLSERVLKGFTLIRPTDVDRVLEAIRTRAGYRPPRGRVGSSHEDLVRELLELGEWLGFVTRKDERTPDNVYRLDVTWRRSPERPPVKVFEVELGRDVDRALARLKHAYDVWNCQQLWLVVSDEASAERARKLVEPVLRGAFEEIRDRVIILGWRDVHRLHMCLKHYKDVLKELMRR
jgi:hypothetical protein